jgi:hypothetical protein
MKKFIMITPLQPIINGEDRLIPTYYQAAGNSKLVYDRATRFPLIHLLNGYAEKGEEIRIITITPETKDTPVHLQQLKEEVQTLQDEKGFICRGVESISVKRAGDVETQIYIFHNLMAYMENGDTLYACLTYGDKPMPIAELMAIQYGYRVFDDVLIDCLVYGEKDHNKKDVGKISDITALIQLDEIVRMLADNKIVNPKRIIDSIIGEE